MLGDLTKRNLGKPRLGCKAMREGGRDPDFKAGAAQKGKIFEAQRGITQSLLILPPKQKPHLLALK